MSKIPHCPALIGDESHNNNHHNDNGPSRLRVEDDPTAVVVVTLGEVPGAEETVNTAEAETRRQVDAVAEILEANGMAVVAADDEEQAEVEAKEDTMEELMDVVFGILEAMVNS